MVTKLNVNIRAVLSNCEELVKDETSHWRMAKYIKTLDTMIDELEEYKDAESLKKIPNYKERLEILKTITNYHMDGNSCNTSSSSSSINAKNVERKKQNPQPITEAGDNALKEIRQFQNAEQFSSLRKDLLSDDKIRHRKQTAENSKKKSENMNEALKYYSDAQEKIAEHMLSLTYNLKEQTQIANKIIKRDTETVARSTNMADRNMNSLNKEAEKLQDHSRNAWKCWLWLMIAFVIVVFIGMVLLMKIVKKKR